MKHKIVVVASKDGTTESYVDCGPGATQPLRDLEGRVPRKGALDYAFSPKAGSRTGSRGKPA